MNFALQFAGMVIMYLSFAGLPGGMMNIPGPIGVTTTLMIMKGAEGKKLFFSIGFAVVTTFLVAQNLMSMWMNLDIRLAVFLIGFGLSIYGTWK